MLGCLPRWAERYSGVRPRGSARHSLAAMRRVEHLASALLSARFPAVIEDVSQETRVGPWLHIPGNGQGSTLQEGGDHCAIDLQPAVVADEAPFLEPIHKLTYPCAGGPDHLRQG